MRITKTLTTIFIFCLSFLSIAQQDSINTEGLNSTLSKQFDHVYRVSSNYEKYKVVSKSNFNHLKKSSLDSVQKYLNAADLLKSRVETLSAANDSLSKDVELLSTEIQELKNSKDNFSIFGLKIKKGLYSVIVFSIIGFLLLTLGLFLLKYKSVKNESEVAVGNLSKLEEEYSEYKRKAMEKEQVLGRKLQDEINKQNSKKKQ
jgi:preprotein translocase subunit SecG